MKIVRSEIIKSPIPIVWDSFNSNEYENWIPDWFFTKTFPNPTRMARIKEDFKQKIFIARIEDETYLRKKSGTLLPLHSKLLPIMKFDISFKPLEEGVSEITFVMQSIEKMPSEKRVTFPSIILLVNIIELFKENFTYPVPIPIPMPVSINESMLNSINSFLRSLSVGGLPRLPIALLTGVVVTLMVNAVPFVDLDGPDLHIKHNLEENNIPSDYHQEFVRVTPIATDISGIHTVDCEVPNGGWISVGKTTSFDCWAIDNSPNKNKTIKRVEVYVAEPSKEHWPQCLNSYLTESDQIKSDFELDNIHETSKRHFKNLISDLRLESYEAFNNKDYDYSIETSSAIVNYLDPNDSHGLSLLGVAIRDHNREDIDRLRCAIEIHSLPTVEIKIFGKMALAEDYFLLGEFKKTIDTINPVIEGFGNNYEIEDVHYVNSLIIRGNAELRMGLFSDAERDYQKSIEFGGPMADALFGLGAITIFRDQNHDDAIEYFYSSLDENPDHEEALYWLVSSLNEKQRFEEAQIVLEKLEYDNPKLLEKIVEDFKIK